VVASIRARFGLFVLLGAALSGCATTGPGAVGSIPALPITSSDQTVAPFAAASAMPDGQEVASPAGYVSFCLRFADQCKTDVAGPQTVALVPALWGQLRTVNGQVNDSIWPEDDVRHYGRNEFWTIPTDGYGDCEDYALSKRKALLAMGLPEGALRVAVVYSAAVGRHAVLTVATDKGDYVLDNMTSDVRPWTETSYVWIERQDSTKPSGWTSLNRSPTLLAAAGQPLPVTGTH
jgi:predicted transglutaminase-like cysteine proteinase